MIDERDRKIILELQRDARQSDARIARKTGISEASVRRRIARLIEDRVVRIMAVTSPWKVGYVVPAFIGISAELSRLDQVLEALTAMPRLHYVGLVTGQFDIIVWATFRSARDLADFVKRDLSCIPGIIKTETMITLEISKREQGILVDGLEDEDKRALESGTAIPPDRHGYDLEPEAFDDIDYRLMVELQQDARQSDAQVSRKLGLSEATVRRRIIRLIDRGIIAISAVITPYAVGYTTVAFICLRGSPRCLEKIMEKLADMPRVHFLSFITGRFDVLAWATFRSPQELTEFVKQELSSIPGVTGSETFINLEINKRDLNILPADSSKPARTPVK